jgi:hypothetical protein
LYIEGHEVWLTVTTGYLVPGTHGPSGGACKSNSIVTSGPLDLQDIGQRYPSAFAGDDGAGGSFFMSLHRIVLVKGLLLLVGIILVHPCSAQHCSCESPCPSCGPLCQHCQHCKSCRHRHLAAPPQAPVLGSAPAMMAPIIFTPVGPTAAPAAYPPPQAPSDREALKDLLRSIMQSPASAPTSCMCNGSGSSAAPAGAPLAAPQPPPDSPVLERLDRIANALTDLNSRLMNLEARVIGLERK